MSMSRAFLNRYGSLRRSFSSAPFLRGSLDDIPEVTRPWNYVWKPTPYPKTEEERLKSAAKYGMIPEDYEPIPDDGDGFGDYPNLGPSSMDSRSGFVAWDYPNLKRNYGEPLNVNFLYTMDFWGLDDTTKDPKSQPYKLAVFLSFIAFFYVMLNFTGGIYVCVPMAEKQLVTSGKDHYTFEPLD